MIKSVCDYLRAQIREIELDPVLSRYALALVFVHFFTALFWLYQGFAEILRDPVQSYCWPFLSGCDSIKQILGPVAPVLYVIYVGLVFAALFLFQKSAKNSWISLLVLELLKLAYGFLDYRFMGNYHFMPHIVTLIFLFVPQKRFWIRIWIMTFYFAAATLKFNLEWLSGASMSWKVPLNNPRLLQVLALCALLVEVAAPQLLFFKEKLPRYLGLGLLCVFHVASYYWVGFFYPAVMFSLLSFFLLELLFSEPRPADLKGRGFLPIFLVWLGFVGVQLLAMNHSREFALQGEKRLLSLNMFDARSICRGFFLIHKPGQITEVDFKNEELAVRVKCDDVIFLEQARRLCRSQSAETERIEAYLSSRLFSEAQMVSIVRDRDVCKRW